MTLAHQLRGANHAVALTADVAKHQKRLLFAKLCRVTSILADGPFAGLAGKDDLAFLFAKLLLCRLNDRILRCTGKRAHPDDAKAIQAQRLLQRSGPADGNNAFEPF